MGIIAPDITNARDAYRRLQRDTPQLKVPPTFANEAREPKRNRTPGATWTGAATSQGCTQLGHDTIPIYSQKRDHNGRKRPWGTHFRSAILAGWN
jgi:hypothetical protein